MLACIFITLPLVPRHSQNACTGFLWNRLKGSRAYAAPQRRQGRWYRSMLKRSQRLFSTTVWGITCPSFRLSRMLIWGIEPSKNHLPSARHLADSSFRPPRARTLGMQLLHLVFLISFVDLFFRLMRRARQLPRHRKAFFSSLPPPLPPVFVNPSFLKRDQCPSPP